MIDLDIRAIEMDWQLAETKNRLSEVVGKALGEGPQRIIRRGEAVIVVAEADYMRQTGERARFVDCLMSRPSLEGVEFERDGMLMRS